jgi:hypothetical protein
MSGFHKKLLPSDEFAQCSLRATFFVRNLRGMRLWEAIHEVHRIIKLKNSFTWRDYKRFGIDSEAWRRVAEKKIHPLLLFSHPRVLAEQPRLLLYYRTVALISQKGLGTLVGGNIAAVEAGKVEKLEPRWLSEVVIALNSLQAAIIRTAADINADDLPGYQFATAGATIQGSWNNAIGDEGEAAVKTILVKHLQSEIVQVVWRDGATSDFDPVSATALLDCIGQVRVLRLQGGHHLLFSSEPDVSLRDPNDIPVVAVEVKAGADPAGALERLGAAMKSFENDRNLKPRVKTVYVVRSITPELQKRISQGSPFDHTFGLSELLADDRTQRVFANVILRVVLGR